MQKREHINANHPAGQVHPHLLRPATLETQAGYQQAIPGQWIRCQTNNVVFHHGIISGPSLNPVTNTWRVMVIHTMPSLGVIETTLDEFSGRRNIEVVNEPVSPDHQRLILATARENIGKPYNLFDKNCEHFACFCYTHKAESQQLRTALLIGAAAVAGVVLLTKSVE